MRKMSAMMLFQERGCDGAVAGRAALAMMPLDDNAQPGRAFEKAARKLAKQFAKASKKASPAEIDELATGTLNSIKSLAVEHGESHYAERYDQALNRAS